MTDRKEEMSRVNYDHDQRASFDKAYMKKDEIEFSHICFGIYKVVKNSFIFKPEAFIFLSTKGNSYKRIAFNFWIKR